MRRITQKEIAEVKAKLLMEQDGLCALCTEPFTEEINICLDHDHNTGYVRALLCRNCNAMEGKIYNCTRRAKRKMTVIQWMERALAYWRLHQECQTGLLHPKHRTVEEKKERRKKKSKKRRERKKQEKLAQNP